jgi:uncharacterized protein (DUF1499 family)
MVRAVLSCVPLLLAIALLVTGCTGARPPDLGVKNGNLAPCPSSPNCVSSQSGDPGHAVEPLRYTSSAPEAMARLRRIIGAMKRAKVVTESDTYLHVEFTSALFRFVDDVEFLNDEPNKMIHVRSASRLGYSDLGVNRKRVERIRAEWAKT